MLRTIWICMLIAGIVLLVVSLIMLFAFRTFNLIGELTGKNAKKQVARLKSLNVNGTTSSNLVINVETGIEEEIPIKDFSLLNTQISSSKEVEEEVGRFKNSIENETAYDLDSTSYMEDLDSTSYMEVEEMTSFIEDLDDSESTTYLQEGLKYAEKHSVILIEEQTSINLS